VGNAIVSEGVTIDANSRIEAALGFGVKTAVYPCCLIFRDHACSSAAEHSVVFLFRHTKFSPFERLNPRLAPGTHFLEAGWRVSARHLPELIQLVGNAIIGKLIAIGPITGFEAAEGLCVQASVYLPGFLLIDDSGSSTAEYPVVFLVGHRTSPFGFVDLRLSSWTILEKRQCGGISSGHMPRMNPVSAQCSRW